MKTIGAVLDTYKGVGPGFDFLRVALAVSIVFNHSFLIVEGSYDTVDTYRLWAFFGAAMPLFFCLSGFLICGSARRLKLKDFLISRSMRIVPALAVDILVSALIIGTLFTTVPLGEYFSDKEFSHYFLNIIGFIHYELPGMFETNPFAHQVNGSLWTVPYEIGCYLIMSLLIILGAVKSGRGMALFSLALAAVYFGLNYYYSTHESPFAAPTPVNNYINNFLSARGNYLYFFFTAGALMYVFRHSVPYSPAIALASAAVVLLEGAQVIEMGVYRPLLLSPPVAYLVAYIGLQRIPSLPLYSRGDYSYGIYLYAYPIQQLLVYLFPGRFGVFVHFLLSTALVTLVAMVSWHCIEKPVLRMRRKFSFTARKGEDNITLPAADVTR